jgi:cytochrome b6
MVQMLNFLFLQSTHLLVSTVYTFVLPLLTAVFMLMHFLMIRKQGISGPL